MSHLEQGTEGGGEGDLRRFIHDTDVEGAPGQEGAVRAEASARHLQENSVWSHERKLPSGKCKLMSSHLHT